MARLPTGCASLTLSEQVGKAGLSVLSPSHVLPPLGDTPAFHASTAGFLPKGPVLALVITQHLLDLV